MKIVEVNINKRNVALSFPDYHSMIESRKAYWASINREKYEQMIAHLNIVHEHERKLEQFHDMPAGQLRGAHLAFGALRDMRVAMNNAELRHKIRNDFIKFYVTITSETRYVEVQAEDYNSGTKYHFGSYQMKFNFYGMNPTTTI